MIKFDSRVFTSAQRVCCKRGKGGVRRVCCIVCVKSSCDWQGSMAMNSSDGKISSRRGENVRFVYLQASKSNT